MGRLHLLLGAALCACGARGGAGPASAPRPACAAPIAPLDTGVPRAVVGTGSPASCTEAALASAVAGGGIVAFDCGAAPATIAITRTISLPTDRDTVLDGGGRVTLDGGGLVRILDFDHPDYRANDRVLTLQHLTLARGRASGTRQYPPAPAPCSQGFYDGAGGALHVRDGVLHVLDVVFEDNQAAPLGPDVGGGAIHAAGCREVVVVGSTFRNNRGSNGGAIGALNSDLGVYDSTFEGNAATGNGANSDDPSRCSVVDPVTGQHQVGSGGNGGAIAIDGGSDGRDTFCNDRFLGNTAGAGALGGALFRTPDLARQATVVDRCLFDGNSVPAGGGGAMYLHNSALQILSSTISHNSAQGPGGIQADGTTIDLENDTFFGNSATAGLGGALALFSGGGSVRFCTFASNQADGGDPYFGAAITAFASLRIDGSIFQDNTARNQGAPMQCRLDGSSGSGNLQWPRDHVVGGAADAPCAPGIAFADARLGALGDHGGPTPTVLPSAGSPALDAATGCPATDQRGRPRAPGRCTAGAAEGSQ
jgi:hypothetical protein